jgi:hypothetical protein
VNADDEDAMLLYVGPGGPVWRTIIGGPQGQAFEGIVVRPDRFITTVRCNSYDAPASSHFGATTVDEDGIAFVGFAR